MLQHIDSLQRFSPVRNSTAVSVKLPKRFLEACFSTITQNAEQNMALFRAAQNKTKLKSHTVCSETEILTTSLAAFPDGRTTADKQSSASEQTAAAAHCWRRNQYGVIAILTR